MAPIQTKKQDGLHFYWHIKEAEQDFPDDRDYGIFTRVRDMLNEFQFNCPDTYQRFEEQDKHQEV